MSLSDFHGNCYPEELNLWIAELLGVSPTDEDGTPRSIGYSSGPMVAVLWCVTLQFSERYYIAGNVAQIHCNYECTEISRSVHAGDIHISYIIHPVPLYELKNFVVCQCPQIDITYNGEPITFTGANGGQLLMCEKLIVDFVSWVPFDRWTVNKIE